MCTLSYLTGPPGVWFGCPISFLPLPFAVSAFYTSPFLSHTHRSPFLHPLPFSSSPSLPRFFFLPFPFLPPLSFSHHINYQYQSCYDVSFPPSLTFLPLFHNFINDSFFPTLKMAEFLPSLRSMALFKNIYPCNC